MKSSEKKNLICILKEPDKMKKKFKYWYYISTLGLFIIFGITNCDAFKRYKSSPLVEKGEVIQLVYLPNTEQSQVAPGMGIDGNVTFTFIDSGHKEIWGAVFRCYRHNNTFSVLGKDIYSKVKVGQVVDLKYVELYKIKNNMKVIYDYKTIEVIVP